MPRYGCEPQQSVNLLSFEGVTRRAPRDEHLQRRAVDLEFDLAAEGRHPQHAVAGRGSAPERQPYDTTPLLPASPALALQTPLDISFAFLYAEEWNDSTRSSAR